MSEILVAGVAGAGVFGGYHAAKYAALEGVRLAAIYDVDAEKARALAERHGAEPFSSYPEFLKALDVVTIAAPARAHFDLARTALAAGKHVLLEKPVATRLEDAERLVALAARKNLVLQSGHQERFVAEAFGVLSRPKPPRSIWCKRFNPRSGRGEDVSVALDLMIHDLDLLRMLGLGELAAVSAFGGLDEVEAELVFEGGATAVLAASRNAARADRRMALVYDDGVVEIDFVNRRVGNTTATPLAASFEDAATAPALRDPLGLGVARFVEAARAGLPSPIPGEAGRDALAWALRIDEACGVGAVDAPELVRAAL